MCEGKVRVLRAFHVSCIVCSGTRDNRSVFQVSRCESANVSGTFTSQARGISRAHGLSVAPSGRFPSVLDKPAGSLERDI